MPIEIQDYEFDTGESLQWLAGLMGWRGGGQRLGEQLCKIRAWGRVEKAYGG